MDLSGVSRPTVTVPVRRDPKGRTGPTPKAARGPGWRRTGHGFYVPSDVDPDDRDQRVVEAAAMLPDDWGGVTGWAGLSWLQGRWFDGSPWGGGQTQPVVLAVGGNRAIRPQPEYRVETSEERLWDTDILLVDGVRVTHAARSVCFEMRYARDWRLAAVSLGMACFNDLVSIDEVSAYAAGLNGWTGIPQCRKAIPFARENVWSPQEAMMVIHWSVDAGFPPPLCNVPVFGPDGTLLGVPDLLDPVVGVAGEYNGALHLVDSRRARDLVREDLFRSHGLECATMDTVDLADPTDFLRRLAAAYDRAVHIAPERRRWTIEPPPWWVDTTTVAARRALSDQQRAQLLAHRVA